MAKKTKKVQQKGKKTARSTSRPKSLAKADLMPIQPLGDRVLIKEIGEEKMERTTATGIIIPESAEKESGGKKGKVVAVGTGKIDDGLRIPLETSVGDTVLYQWGDKITINNEEYVIVQESQIIAILN